MKKRILFSALVALAFSVAANVHAADLKKYYANANNKKKAELKTSLGKIIASHKKISYGDLWEYYEKVDYVDGKTNSSGQHKVFDYYSDKTFYFNGNGSAVSGMNKEHVAPQSWWGSGTSIAVGSDLFQVLPSESSANSAKSNFVLGVAKTNVKTVNNRMKTGKDASGMNVFEPCDEYKGDFARIYFYVATCYPDVAWKETIDGTLVAFRKESYPTLKSAITDMLLEWNREDPVSDWERTRNERVYGQQGNRNPFVDYPTLPEFIWGDSINYEFDVALGHYSGGTTPTPDPTPEPGDSVLILDQEFKASGVGDFAALQNNGSQSQIWKRDEKYGMVANAYSLGKTGDDYLISPAIDLTGMAGATVEFRHAAGYHNGGNLSSMFQVLVSTDYAQRPSSATWEVVNDVVWPTEMQSATSKFTKFVNTGRISLDEYAGETIYIAFRYTANASNCWAWEIDNMEVYGKALPDYIGGNFISPIDAPDAVFDIDGHYLGTEVPTARGIYIVRQGGYTFKRFVH